VQLYRRHPVYVPNNLRIYSTNYIIIVKNSLRDYAKYICLESARRDLQNSVKILVKSFSK
jgi:hypothetical protein